MAKASRSPKRYSLPPQPTEARNEHREWLQFSLTEQQKATNTTYLQLQQRYSQQNKLLAQTVSKLQAQIGHLELELMNSQREIRSLKLKNTDLSTILKSKVKSFELELTNRISELLMCIDPSSKRELVSSSAIVEEKVDNNFNKTKKPLSGNYLTEFTNNRRRKSALFVGNNMDMNSLSEVSEAKSSESNKDLSFVEEVNEPESEPDYKDTESTLIPIKRQRESQLFTKEQMKCKPKVTLEEEIIPNLSSQNEFMVKEHTPNEALEIVKQDEDCNTVSPSVLEEVANTSNESIIEEEIVSSPLKRKKRVPRELKNLDTEKTKKWLGLDPMVDEMPRSRRSSIAMRFDLPLRDKVNKKRKIDIFNDEENYSATDNFTKEAEVSSEKDHHNASDMSIKKIEVLSEKDANVNNNKEKSIFDLDQQDFLNIAIPIVSKEKPKKTRGRRRKRREDFVL